MPEDTESIIITKTPKRKVFVDQGENESVSIVELIHDRQIDMVNLNRDEAIKLRDILNGIYGRD